MKKSAMGKVVNKLKKKNLSDFFDASKIELKIEQLSSYFDVSECINSLEGLVQWLDDEKTRNHILQKRVGLNTLTDWRFNGNDYFSRCDNKFFKVVGMAVTSPSREVMTWSQPILDNIGTGTIGLLIKRVNKKIYFLMQAKAEVGNRNIVQLAPTVQFTPENYINNEGLKKPFLFDEFYEVSNFITVWENRQAEEGGRFYKKEHVYKILMLPDYLELKIPPEYKWFSYNQIRFFLHMGDFVNSCARSILSCLV